MSYEKYIVVVNSETGELIKKIKITDEEPEETREGERCEEIETEGADIGRYTKISDGIVKKIEQLGASERSLLLSLIPNVRYITNEIHLRGRRNLSTSDISNYAKMSRPTTTNAIDKLIRMGFIRRKAGENRKSVYYMNPEIAMKGRKIQKETSEIFKEAREGGERYGTELNRPAKRDGGVTGCDHE